MNRPIIRHLPNIPGVDSDIVSVSMMFPSPRASILVLHTRRHCKACRPKVTLVLTEAVLLKLIIYSMAEIVADDFVPQSNSPSWRGPVEKRA
jgi:hypothetical protein